MEIPRSLKLSCLAVSLALAICGQAAAQAVEAPTIPQVEVRFGNGMFLPHTDSIIGQKQGWFKDVGISFSPSPYGAVMPSAQGASSLISGTVDVNSAGVYKLLPAMDKARNLRIFVQKDVYSGYRIMAQPDKGYKSYEEFVAAGKKPAEAMRAVIDEIKTGQIAFEPGPEKSQFFDLLFKAAGMAPTEIAQLHSLVVEDAQSTAMMIGERIEFQLGGAPAMTELTSRGFKPLVTAFDLAKNADVLGDAGVLAVFKVGWGTTQQYYEANHDTILRLASVYYRIADFIKAHPQEAAAIHVPFLNSVAGTQMKVETGLLNYQQLDRFYTFSEQNAWYNDPNDPLYYLKEINARIHDAEHKGVIAPNSMDPELIMVADDVYRELSQLQKDSDTLIKNADTAIKQKPSGMEKASGLLATAKAQYAAYDFLDAKRFAEASVAAATAAASN
jgi:ABC-type nitrate/sulfonate/bicarbonate transport system substrate-binding protein